MIIRICVQMILTGLDLRIPGPDRSPLRYYPETSFALMHSSYSYSKSPSHQGGLNNLSGYILVERWLWVGVSFWLTRALNISKFFYDLLVLNKG